MERLCPICNEVLAERDEACPRCGFKLIGATEAFKPVKDTSGQATQTPAQKKTPVLRVIKGSYSGQEFAMGEGTFTVGRDPSCDLFLSNMTVSRHHATITIDASGARIEDEGSTNGTWINGNIIDRSVLLDGSLVQIGVFEMIYEEK